MTGTVTHLLTIPLAAVVMAIALGCHAHTAPPESFHMDTLICEQQAVVQDVRTEAYIWAQYVCTRDKPTDRTRRGRP